MITVQVTYKVNDTFVDQNQSNISAFLADFKNKKTSNFLYHVNLKEDGVTFVHLAMYETEEIQRELLATPSFLKFQEERDESGIIGDVVIENLTHLGSSLGVIS